MQVAAVGTAHAVVTPIDDCNVVADETDAIHADRPLAARTLRRGERAGDDRFATVPQTPRRQLLIGIGRQKRCETGAVVRIACVDESLDHGLDGSFVCRMIDVLSPRTAGKDGEDSTREQCSSQRVARSTVLERIIRNTPEDGSVVIATTGYTGRELFAIADRPNHLYMVGSMGCASAFGLGLALARPDLQVVVVDGDGAALMRMGNFATLGSYGGGNLTHLLLDNEAHDSTGAQATVSANVRFADIAAACGYAASFEGNDVALVDELLALQGLDGPRFGHLKIRTGTLENLPRPSVTPPEVLRRLMNHIGTRF